MAIKFKSVGLVGRISDPRVAEPLKALAGHLAKTGAEVLVSQEIAAQVTATKVNEADLADQANLIIAVGGDGTMLYAANLLRGRDVPLLGVNRGRLGFLADVSPAEMLDSVDQVQHGDFLQDSRMLLQAEISYADGSKKSAVALNDVVLQRRETGRMVDFETRIAGNFVNCHSGDGLVVATPTGSTAYALSCGGPIIEPQLDAIVVVPICPHTLSDRPIVVPAELGVSVSVLRREDTRADVTVDGRPLGMLEQQDLLTISRSADRINLIHPPGYDFYEILRSKLHWGLDNRSRDTGPSGS